MDLVIKEVKDKLIFQVKNDMDSIKACEFEDQVLETITKENKDIILDFSAVKYISIKGVSGLVRLNNIAKDKKLSLVVMKLSQDIRSILKDIGVDDLFIFADTLSFATKVNGGVVNNHEVEKDKIEKNLLEDVAGGDNSSSGGAALRKKDDVCNNWINKSFVRFSRKRCGNCKFFKEEGFEGTGRCLK